MVKAAEGQLKAQYTANEAVSAECAICLDEMAAADTLALACGHVYHRSCVVALRKYGVSEVCPLCRAPLPPRAEQLRIEASMLLLKAEKRSAHETFETTAIYKGSVSKNAHDNLPHAAVLLYGQARALLLQSLNEDPECAQAHFALGVTMQYTGDNTGALAAFRQAVKLRPVQAVANHNMGVVLACQGDHRSAAAAFQLAIAHAPRDAEWNASLAATFTSLGASLGCIGDRAGALAAFRRASVLDPADSRVLCNLGVALTVHGITSGNTEDMADGIAWLKRTISLDPKNAVAAIKLGDALAASASASGDLSGAIAAYKLAISMDPDHSDKGWPGPSVAYCNLGCAQGKAGDRASALASFRSAIALDPNDPESHQNTGCALLLQGDVDGAIAAFDRAADLGSAGARQNLHGLRLQGAFSGSRRSSWLDQADINNMVCCLFVCLCL
jgi:Flp pilus assembly protein TadD